jgi:V-type H+-transporting ATPase 16kDa proteolipid subunit
VEETPSLSTTDATRRCVTFLAPTIANGNHLAHLSSPFCFPDAGAAYGTAKAGVGIMVSGISSPELVWKNLIPIIMAGVNGIYGLITAIIVLNQIVSPMQGGVHQYSLYTGFAHLAAGFCCGLCGLGSGMAIGIAGDAGVRSCGAYDFESRKVPAYKKGGFMLGGGSGYGKKKKNGNGDQLFVAMVLIQVFAGNLALYGLITSIILTQTSYICEY